MLENKIASTLSGVLEEAFKATPLIDLSSVDTIQFQTKKITITDGKIELKDFPIDMFANRYKQIVFIDSDTGKKYTYVRVEIDEWK